MRILIYGRFSSHHFAIRNVITNICKGLNDTFDFLKNEIIVLSNTTNAEAFAELKNLKIDTLDISPDNAVKNQLYTLFKLPKYIKRNNIDLVVFPQITFYYWKKCKTIFYIHDLIEYKVRNQKFLSLKLRKFFYYRAVKISDRIITVSENSRFDIQKILHAPAEKIDVLYCGRDESLIPLKQELSLSIIRKELPTLKDVRNYLLYVGYLAHPQKNLLFVLENIGKILQERDLSFILVGPNGKDADLIHAKIVEQNQKLDRNRIISTGAVAKELLSKLYSAASGFIFVSQYEGFGMPVLEAMSCGCPVITSNVSSLPEVASDCAELINPYDATEFKTKLCKLLDEGKRPVEFYNRPLNRYTWKNHVAGLIKILYSMATV